MSLSHPFILAYNSDSCIDSFRFTVLRARHFSLAATHPGGERLLGYRCWSYDYSLMYEDNSAEKARGEAEYDDEGGELGDGQKFECGDFTEVTWVTVHSMLTQTWTGTKQLFILLSFSSMW